LKAEYLNKMPYLKACLKENFRITPTTAGNARILPSDIELSGYNVPAGTFISVGTTTACMDDQIFENAQEFKPERWLKESKLSREKDLHDHPYMILPFGIGPRMCIGSRLAESEIYAVIASMILKYKFSLAPDSPVPERLNYLTVHLDPPPKFKLETRM